MSLDNRAAGITMDASSYLTNYGSFAYGPDIIVWHSLECDAIPHIAEELSGQGGWLDNEGLAPQRMTDPASIVRTVPDGDQGGHIGGPGNSHAAGVETSGRAAWTPAQWAEPNARAAVDHQARAVAGLAIVYGWSLADIRWLSLAQVRAGARGMADHNDISLSGISNTNHWDVGKGFPFAWALKRTRYWFQVMTGNTPAPSNPTKSPEQLEEEELMAAKDEIINGLFDKIKTEIYSPKFLNFVATSVWTKSITNEAANTLLARAAGSPPKK